MTQDLSRPAQEILDAYDNTSEHSIAERKALAAALRMLMNQHQEYADDGCGPFIVYCYDIWSVVDELERSCEEELDDEGNITTPAQPERIEKGELISEDVIEDCRDLNSDQLYAAMYGAIQKLMVKVEALETEVAALKSQ